MNKTVINVPSTTLMGRVAPAHGPAVNSAGPVLKRGSINRGRFEKFYEEKNGYVRYWGMCDVTAKDYQIFVPSEIFYAFLDRIKIKDFKNIKEIMKDLDMDVQRFLLDGLSPTGWKEMAEAFESIGFKESLCHSGLGGIKKIMLIAQHV